MKNIVICDLDGTVANLDHRLPLVKNKPYYWDTFYDLVGDDGVYSDVIEVVRLLTSHTPNCRLIYVTGRLERCRQNTLAWFEKHNLPVTDTQYELHMRPNGDSRPDYVVKLEIFSKLQIPVEQVLCVFDDRDQVVRMWRSLGLRVFQVQNGNY